MADSEIYLLRSSLDLLVLKALTWGAMHGYGINEWIESATASLLLIEEGTLYPALHRLEAQGLLDATWREGGLGPRRRYYRITRRGVEALEAQASEWETFALSVRLVAGTAPANG